MLMRCTRRATASTKAMEAMAPAKAAAIIMAELVSIPRSRNTTMVRATASFAPLETPMTKGPAMGFAKKVCRRYPAALRAAPSSAAMTARGRRSCRMMFPASASPPLPSSAVSTAPGARDTLPQNRFSAKSTATAAARAI